MMAVLERDLRVPAAVGTLLKRVRIGAPIVKVAEDRDVFGLRRKEQKVDGLEIIFCRVTIRATEIV